MFHFWHNSIQLPQANLTEPALYAVAFTGESMLSSGGKCPQGLYPASPLSASECVEAKQGSGNGTSVRELTGTVASVMLGGDTSVNLMDPLTGKTRGNPTGTIAGGTGSVAYLPNTGMSLRGNDGGRIVRGSQKEASAMGATTRRSASFIATQGRSYRNDSRLLHS